MTFDPLLSDTSRRPPCDAGPALQEPASAYPEARMLPRAAPRPRRCWTGAAKACKGRAVGEIFYIHRLYREKTLHGHPCVKDKGEV